MKNALVTVGLVIVVAAFIWGSMHVFVTRVNPKQEPPSGHFSSACWACHFVSGSANTIEE